MSANPFMSAPDDASGANPFMSAPDEETSVLQDLGNLGAGALRGAASIGATVIAPFQAAGNDKGMLENREETLKRLDDALQYFGANKESGLYKTGKIGAEIAGTLGAGGATANLLRAAAPGATRLATAIETMGSSAGTGGRASANAATRLAGGGISGGVMSGMIDPDIESVGVGAGLGAAIPVVGAAASKLTKVAGGLYDAIRGDLAAVKAGQLLRDAAGSKLGAIQAANAVSAPGITAAQAAHGVDADVYQALMKYGQHFDPETYFRPLLEGQEAARLSALQSVTPDLAAAEAIRESNQAANYAQAFLKTKRIPTKGDPDLAKIANNPFVQDAFTKARNVIEAKGLDPYKNTTEYLHEIKLGLDSLLKGPEATSLQSTSRREIASVKDDLVNWLKNKNPDYDIARKQFAKDSEAINQAKVLGEMTNVLQRGGGGERVQPFLDVMGRGENALLKRANQDPRFGGIADVLTPQQLSVRDDIANQLIRDRDIATQAKAGAGGLERLLDADLGKARLPSYLSVVASTTNKALDMLESKIARDTVAAVIEAAKSGFNANEIMKILPAHERSKVMQWIAMGGPNRYLGVGASVGVSQ